RYHRDALRRVAVVLMAQRLGLSLDDVRAALAALPDGRTPNKADWARLSRVWRQQLDDQIVVLQRLRDNLSGCIGCGCLSLSACRMHNPEDIAAEARNGPRYLLYGVPEL